MICCNYFHDNGLEQKASEISIEIVNWYPNMKQALIQAQSCVKVAGVNDWFINTNYLKMCRLVVQRDPAFKNAI